MAEKRWHGRGFTSLSTLFGFLIMSVTGLVLYVVPEGRIAYWNDWSLLGLTKTQWGDIHILSSLLFVVAGAFHTYFNWKPLMNYLRDKTRGGVRLKRELAVSAVLSVLLVVSGIAGLPPLSYLLDLNAAVKGVWVAEPDDEPPFGHAELVSLSSLCKKTEIPLDAALSELRSAGLSDVAPNRTILEIAQANGLTPRDIYAKIRVHEAVPEPPAAGALSVEHLEELLAGSGLGNKTLPELCERLGVDLAEVQARLKRKGLQVSTDRPLKQAAREAGFPAPLELLKAALFDETP